MSKSSFYASITAVVVALLLLAGCGGGEKPKTEEPAGGPLTKDVVLVSDTLTADYLDKVPAELGGKGFTGKGWLSNENYEATGDPRAVKGGKLTMALYDFPSTLRTEGKESNTTLNSYIGGMSYESLIGIHGNTLELVPGLATHWKIQMDTTRVDTPQTFWFRINPKARWVDGKPITAYDVVATYNLKMDPGILFPSTQMTYAQYFEPVAESPYIVRISTKKLNWRLFLYFGGMEILPEKYIGKLTGAGYLKEYQFKMVPGSGPYELKLENIDKGKSISITRRKDYWDIDNPKGVGFSNYDTIKWVVVSDDRLMFEMFKKGELDFLPIGKADRWIKECDFPDVQRGLIQKRKIYNDEARGFSGFAFNMRKEPFNDKRMRQAFTYLFNRERLMATLFHNQYLFLDSYFPGGTYENPTNPQFRYDPKKAAQLLAECGYTKRNKEGWLVNDKGQMIDLTLRIDQESQRIFTVIQEDLKEAGIKLNLENSTGPTMFKMVMERNFTITYQSWGGLLFPNPETSWHSTLADSNNTNNLCGVKNERIDQICKEYNVVFNQAERVKLIQEVDSILMDIQPYALGWFAPYSRFLYWNKFGHPEHYLSRTGSIEGAIMGSWWIDPAKQAKLEQARKDESIKLEVGEVEHTYWIDQAKKVGRKMTSNF